MKYLFFIALISLVILLLYWRLRPYIHLARRVHSFMRGAQGLDLNATTARTINNQAKQTETLIRCQTCGVWTPASRATTQRAAAYCSTECMNAAHTKQVN